MDSNLYNEFVNNFSNVMCHLTDGNEYSNIIFLCIGTDRITGDAFGPLVGSKLNSLFSYANRINVIGNLENTVNSSNILNVSEEIRNNYTNPFIVAIDSAMSSRESVGSILVNEGPLSTRNKHWKNVCVCWTYEYKGNNCRKFK